MRFLRVTTWELFKLSEVERLRSSVQSTTMQNGGYLLGTIHYARYETDVNFTMRWTNAHRKKKEKREMTNKQRLFTQGNGVSKVGSCGHGVGQVAW